MEIDQIQSMAKTHFCFDRPYLYAFVITMYLNDKLGAMNFDFEFRGIYFRELGENSQIFLLAKILSTKISSRKNSSLKVAQNRHAKG